MNQIHLLKNFTYKDMVKPVIFSCGGLTDCTNWQKQFFSLLKNQKGIILNPRRMKNSITGPTFYKNEVRWRLRALHISNLVSFWFSKDTKCPIQLYELGFYITQNSPLFIGIEKGYENSEFVHLQVRSQRPFIKITDNLDELSEQIKGYIAKY